MFYKRMLLLCLVIALVVCMVPQSAFATGKFSIVSSYTYEKDGSLLRIAIIDVSTMKHVRFDMGDVSIEQGVSLAAIIDWANFMKGKSVLADFKYIINEEESTIELNFISGKGTAITYIKPVCKIYYIEALHYHPGVERVGIDFGSFLEIVSFLSSSGNLELPEDAEVFDFEKFYNPEDSYGKVAK